MNYKKLFWIVFGLLSTLVGLYPFVYAYIDANPPIMIQKPQEVLDNHLWYYLFFTHIFTGGGALLIGWTQFSKRWRAKRIRLHRNIGIAYVVLVLLSGISGLYIAFYASGGGVAKMGFGMLAVLWLITTSIAFISIKNKEIEKHQRWMIRSYALTFAAVTLRLWLPILPSVFTLEFLEAYRIIAWLCWVPNLIFAEFLIRKL